MISTLDCHQAPSQGLIPTLNRLVNNTRGIAMLGLLLISIAVPGVMLAVSEMGRLVKDAERTTKSSQTKQTMNMIRDYLINNARDIDSNGQPDVPKEGTGNSLPASLPFSGTDMFGTAYMYCTWHVGPGNNTNGAYSQNNTTPPKTGLIAKLISAGADKTFQTSCDDVNANGDDIAYETFNTSTTFVNNGWTAGAGNIFATGMSDMIGIGTNTPPSRVTIYDSANISDAQQQIRIGVAANRDYTVGRMSASGLMKFAGSEAGTAGYIFEANGNERFKIAPATGNAQFGAPGADTGERVQVAGVIKTTDGTKMSKFGADVIAVGAVGIGSTTNHDFVVGANNTEVIRAGVDGTTTLSKSANASAFGAAGNLVIANPTGSQSQIQFTHAGVTNSTIRSDSSGNLVLNSRSGAIYLNNDSGVSAQIYSPGNTIVLPASAGIGTAAGAFNLNVNGSTNTGTLYVAGNLLSDANRNILVTSVDSVSGYRIRDTRAVNDAVGANPTAASFDMKLNATIGNAGAGAYSTVMTLTPWMDDSAGGSHQVAYSQDGNIYNRYGTRSGGWGGWKRNITSSDVNGTIGYIPKFTGANSVGDSSISDDGAGHVGFNSVGTNRQSLTISSIGNGSAYNDIVQAASDISALGNSAPKSWTWSYRKDGYFTASTAGSYELYGVLKDGSGYYSPLALKSDGDIILASPRNTVRSGNVGIGTTNPSAKLDVNGSIVASGGRPVTISPTGNITIKGDTGGWNNFLSFQGSAGTSLGSFGALGGADSISYLYAGASYINPTMVWTNSNVGIGTTAPNQKLSINGGIGFANQNDADKKLYSPADGTLEWMTHDSAGTHGFAVSHQGIQRVFLNTNGSSYLTGGNLLLNTTSQASTGKIFVKDDSNYNSEWNSAGLVITNNSATNPALRLGTDTVNNVSYIQGMQLNQTWAGNLSLQAAGGKVGVGTHTPNALMHIYDPGNTPATGTLIVENGGNANFAIKSGSSSTYSYQTFYQGNTGQFEMGVEANTGNFYMNKNVQSGSNNFSLLINKSNGDVNVGQNLIVNNNANIAGTLTFTGLTNAAKVAFVPGSDYLYQYLNGNRHIMVTTPTQRDTGALIWSIEDTQNWIHKANIYANGNAYFAGEMAVANIVTNGNNHVFAGTAFNSVIGSGDTRTLALNGTGSSSMWWNGSGTPQFAVDSTPGGGGSFWVNNGSWFKAMSINSAGLVELPHSTSGSLAINNADNSRNLRFYSGAAANNSWPFAADAGVGTIQYSGSTGPYNIAFAVGNTEMARVTQSGLTVVGALSFPGGFRMRDLGASGYAEINNWIHLPGFHGLYSAQNGAHLYPNDGTYGAWKILGRRNGWGGLEFGDANASLMAENKYFGYLQHGYGWWFRVDSSGHMFNPGAYYPGYNNGSLGEQTSYFLYGNTNSNGIRTNGNFLVDGNIYWGTKGVWLDGWINQPLLTSSSPSFATVYSSNWFRSTGDSGWYNENYHTGIRSTEEGVIDVYNSARLRISRNNAAINNSSYDQGNLELKTTDGSSPILGFHRGGSSAGSLYHSGYGTGSLRYRGADGVDGQVLINGVGETNWFVQGVNTTRTSDMTDPNAHMGSGFYNMCAGTNVPYNSWWSMINVRHTNEGNNYGMQFLGSFFNQGDLYYRIQNGDSFSGGWGKIWTQHNSPVVGYLGIGNANSLRHTSPDGFGWIEFGAQNASWAHIQTDRPSFYFNKKVTVDAGGIALYNSNWSVDNNGYMTVNGGGSYRSPNYFYSNMGSGTYLGSSSGPGLQVYSNDGSAAFMSFHRSGLYAVNMGLDPDNVFRIGGWSAPSARMSLDMAGNLTTAGNISSSGNISAAGTITATGTITGSKLYNAVYN